MATGGGARGVEAHTREETSGPDFYGQSSMPA
jgi:hypothetical protein